MSSNLSFGNSPSAMRRLGRVLICTILVFLAGCQTLPESGVKTFADSTSTLKTTLTTASDAAVQEVGMVFREDKPTTDPANNSGSLQQAWSSRIKVLDAMDNYADSLSALVNAGKSGQENAAKFADSLKNLVDAANGVPYAAAATPAVKAVLDGAAVVYGKIAVQIAAGKIQEAVEAADPIVSAVAELFAADLINLRSIARQSRLTAVTQLNSENDSLATMNGLTNARTVVARKAFGNPPDGASIDLLKKINDAGAALSTDPKYVAYLAQLKDINQVYARQNDLLDQASLTLGAWASGHHKIVVGLRDKTAPSLKELAEFSSDLYTIYQDYRTARSKASQ